MYYKGANMLHTLRQLIKDDDKWRKILRGLNTEFHHKTVTTKQIETYISDRSGLNLAAFFDQYLRDTRIPTLEYYFKDTKLRYRWSQVVNGFEMPATLVHDDVVDESDRRRGFFSINALWKNKIAVLVGDFLLSKGLLLCIDNNDFDLLKIISVAVREMSEGELLQIEKARNLDITEEIYYEIIRQKTATLIAACCSLGAASVKPLSKDVETMRKFGELIGMSFQIKDDLFDYGNEQIGKPTGIDIKEQKMTLPLIYVINQCSKKEKRWLINSVKNHNKNSKRVNEVINFVKQNGGLDYAVSKMKSFQQEALELLEPFPESIYKKSLILMVNYVIERNK
jgi:octaprenyl-diphosphate synthase